MDLQFNVDLAAKYGLDEAVFLNSIYFWIRKNAANKKNRKDGHYWTYNTRTALADLFPFWSPRQIDRIAKSCVDQGLLWNNLLRLSYGDPAWMTKLLDKANEHQWLTVYQLKDDELPKPAQADAAAGSGVVDTSGLRFV